MNAQQQAGRMNDPRAPVGRNGGAGARPWRIALYSPGMVGIGHMRRNLRIAQALADSPLEAVVLMIAEAREANVLALPPGGDCLTLPALRKEADGCCKPRYLNIPLDEVLSLRARAIGVALEAFRPDVLIVDHLPRGALQELDGTLEELQAAGHTRCILGLRDVLEHPDRVREEWGMVDNEAAVRNYYDAVWIYGDPVVYDPVRAYGFSAAVAAKARYIGYLDGRTGPPLEVGANPLNLPDLPDPAERVVLCTVGGGQDGADLAEAFAQMNLPPGTAGVLLMGPFMPPEVQQHLRLRASENPRLRVLGYVADPELLLRRADRVIAMGGYNTVYEVLALEKHALIVPRSKPRHEQQIRAECLRRLGLLEVLPPEEVNPGTLGAWLARDLGPPPRVRERINLNGLARLPLFLQQLLVAPPCPDWDKTREEEVQHVAL
jgi:predicted glycosyltransferase